MVPNKVEPIKCVHNKLLVTTHLPKLFAKYKLTKFLCFRDIVYPRLVKMIYANLGLIDDKVSCYVMHKYLIIDVELLAKEFEMDASPPQLIIRSLPNYKKKMAIDILFHY